MSKKKKPLEAVNGRYTAWPHDVADSIAFTRASSRAKAALLDLLRQHNGSNNGHLHLAESWLKARGWTSSDQIQKAKHELIERGLIIQTRQGGRNAGASLFALTWLPITNYTNLDIKRGSYAPGAWRLLDPMPTIRLGPEK